MTPPDDLTRIKGSTDPLMRFFDELHAAADRHGAEEILAPTGFSCAWTQESGNASMSRSTTSSPRNRTRLSVKWVCRPF